MDDIADADLLPPRIPTRVVDRRRYKDVLVPEIAARAEQGLIVCAIGLLAFGGLDWLVANPNPQLLSAIKLVQLATVGAAVLVLRISRRRIPTLLAIQATLAVLYLGTAASQSLVGNLSETPLVFSVLAIASASLLPWGLRAQAVSLLPVGLIGGFSFLGSQGTSMPLDPTAFATVAFALAASVFVASHTESQRVLGAQIEDTENALHESEARRAAIVSAALDGMLVADGEGKIVEFNRAAEWMFGVHREDALGVAIVDLLLPPRLRDTQAEAWSAVIESEHSSLLAAAEEMVARRADGSEFPAEFAVARSDWRGRPILVVQVRDISRRRQIEAELRLLHRNLEGEVQARTSQLDLANKELETLAYSVSHDLRTPLRTIEGFAEILVSEHRPELGPEADAHLRRIRDAAKRMSQLLNGVLTLSRVVRGELRRESVDISALAADVTAERRSRECGRDVEVNIQDGLTTAGDSRLLRVVLEQLVANAFQYTRGITRGRIDIGERDGEFFVEDNGRGFDPAYAGKLFQPFTRLHDGDDGDSCGIGLATVARIVRRHGGRVRAEAAVNRGATFYFRLPNEGADAAAMSGYEDEPRT